LAKDQPIFAEPVAAALPEESPQEATIAIKTNDSVVDRPSAL
jgi:hypothetical protein